jgi:hypothetical protein
VTVFSGEPDYASMRLETAAVEWPKEIAARSCSRGCRQADQAGGAPAHTASVLAAE